MASSLPAQEAAELPKENRGGVAPIGQGAAPSPRGERAHPQERRHPRHRRLEDNFERQHEVQDQPEESRLDDVVVLDAVELCAGDETHAAHHSGCEPRAVPFALQLSPLAIPAQEEAGGEEGGAAAASEVKARAVPTVAARREPQLQAQGARAVLHYCRMVWFHQWHWLGGVPCRRH